MTKKHYDKFAEMLANRFLIIDKWNNPDARNIATNELLTISYDLIKILADDNPKFDRARFITYVNVKRLDDRPLLV